MATHLDRPIYYDDPHKQEPLHRRYGWTALLYATFAAFIILFFLLVR